MLPNLIQRRAPLILAPISGIKTKINTKMDEIKKNIENCRYFSKLIFAKIDNKKNPEQTKKICSIRGCNLPLVSNE